jgi:5-methylcytosine-specific restriction endonuclease McrA
VNTRSAPLSDKRARLARNRRFRALGLPYKACSCCFAVKSVTAFGSHPNTADGHQSQCKVCHASGSARYRTTNPDRVADQKRQYRKGNPGQHRAENQRRRARKRGATAEVFTSAELLDYWDSIGAYGCVYCDGPYEHDDHVQPLALGGAHSRTNLLPACATCNIGKGAIDSVVYINARYGLTLGWPHSE